MSGVDTGMTIPAAGDGDVPIILCVGLFGSASTWLFNVVLALLRHHRGAENVAGFFADTVDAFPSAAEAARAIVVKSHAPARSLRFLLRGRRALGLMTIRDPGDAAASMMQRFEFSFARARDAVVASAQQLCAIDPADIAMTLRFETRFYQHPATVATIAARLGLPCSDETARDIAWEFSEEQVAARLDTLAADNTFGDGDPDRSDPETLLHPRHLGDRRVGKCHDVLRPAQCRELAVATAQFCARHGYDDATIRLGRAGILQFDGQGGESATLVHGFSAPEGAGVWTVDSHACLRLQFREPIRDHLECEIVFTPCVSATPPRAVRGSIVIGQGKEVPFGYPPADKKSHSMTLSVPAARLRDPGCADIEFHFAGLHSLKEMGVSPDERRLGLLLTALSFTAR